MDRPTFVVPDTPPDAVAPARDSASVILARDGDAGLEVFMLERVLRSDFAGGAFVFPGGKLDDADGDAGIVEHLDGWPRAGAWEASEEDATARALLICAIRETFEEAGVLFARSARGNIVSLRAGAEEDWAAARRAIHAGELTALQGAQRNRVRFAADLLRFWARWQTPAFAPKRYDTRFFVARMPDGQEPLHDDIESSSGRWITPTDALRLAAEGSFTIIFPTRKMLEALTTFPDAASLWDAAGDGRDPTPVLPRLTKDGDAWRIVMPDGTTHEP
jgi:8-oxo-dGTP pyrophosphatase MutT (NUDIX family)